MNPSSSSIKRGTTVLTNRGMKRGTTVLTNRGMKRGTTVLTNRGMKRGTIVFIVKIFREPNSMSTILPQAQELLELITYFLFTGILGLFIFRK